MMTMMMMTMNAYDCLIDRSSLSADKRLSGARVWVRTNQRWCWMSYLYLPWTVSSEWLCHVKSFARRLDELGRLDSIILLMQQNVTDHTLWYSNLFI